MPTFGVRLTWRGGRAIPELGNARALLAVVTFLLHSHFLDVILYSYAVSARIVGGCMKAETEQETGTGKVRADARPRHELDSTKIIETVIPYMLTVLYSCKTTLKCVILFDLPAS